MSFQHTSFKKFLETGFLEAFQKVTPLSCEFSGQTFEIHFFPEWIQFRKPESTAQQALHFGKTYGCSVYIPVLLTCTQWQKPKMEWLLLGFLPLMTEGGHFIINGIPRVVLYQMVRNPGVYTIAKDSRTRVPTMRIVPEQGSWINITIDKKNRVWITTRLLRRKVSVLIFLQALGVSLFEIKRYWRIRNFRMKYYKTLKANEKTRHARILQRANLKGHPQNTLKLDVIFMHMFKNIHQ